MVTLIWSRNMRSSLKYTLQMRRMKELKANLLGKLFWIALLPQACPVLLAKYTCHVQYGGLNLDPFQLIYRAKITIVQSKSTLHTNQYLLAPSLTLDMTVPLLFIESIEILKYSVSRLSHLKHSWENKSSAVERIGRNFPRLCLITGHTFSIGFRSGLCTGHRSTRIHTASKNNETFLVW